MAEGRIVPDVVRLRRDAESTRLRTVDAYGCLLVPAGELLAVLDELERFRSFA